MGAIIWPWTIEGTSGANDSSWANTVLLLGCNGTNGSFTFTDESAAAHGTGTVESGASVDTSSKVFGTGSMRLDSGFNDQVRWDDSADWTLGTSDFTIEMFVRFSDVTVGQFMVTHYNTVSNQRAWTFEANLSAVPKTLSFSATASGSVGTTQIVVGNWSPTQDTWYYVCAERSGNTFRIYAGSPGGSTTMIDKQTNAINIFDSTAQLRVSGTGNAAGCMNGNLDEIRITKNTARYANDSGYPVPTAAFPRS